MRTRSKRKSKRTCREAGSFFRDCPSKGGFLFLPSVAASASLLLAEAFQPGDSTPRFLATQRSAVSSLGEEVAQRKPFKRVSSGRLRKQKGCGPFEIPGVPDLQCLTSRAPPTYFGSTLFLVCTALLVCKMSDDLPAEQQIWKTCPPQGIFALQKSLRAGCDGGRGSSSQRTQPPRKEISRGNLLCAELGLPSLSYPSTREYSKVRRHARFVILSVPGSPESQRGCCPSVWEGVQREPFQGFPLGNFFAEARHGASLRS